MTIEARIRELGNRHRQLEEAIRQEMIHPAADSLQLRSLKQRKLRLKDMIAALESRLIPDLDA